MKKINISKQFLMKEYIKNKKSINKIAKLFGCGKTTIWGYLNRYNIPRRAKNEAIKLVVQGKNNPNFKHGKYCKEYYCINCGEEINYQSALYGQGRCYSCSNKLKWKDKCFRNKTIKAQRKGMKLTPNKLEQNLNKILQNLFSKEYKFVGDGKIFISGFVPDFINCNGQKKIIELYGDYWHNQPKAKLRDKQRIRTYTKYGYKTLIIWEHELKDLNIIKNRILEFNKRSRK